MKIKIYKLADKDNQPIKDALSLTKTENIVDLITESKKFKKLVASIRKEFNIPADGFPQERHQSERETIAKNDWKFTVRSKSLLRKLNLPSYWQDSIEIYLLRDAFLTPTRNAIEIRPPKINYNPYIDSRKLHIYIKEKMSRSQFDKLIDEHWQEIEKYMELLPKTVSHKMQRVNIAKQISEFREKDKKEFHEIADILQKKYIDSDLYDLLTEPNVKMMYYRWKKKITEQDNASSK